MFFRSIRFRLTIWYALTLAVILTASGLFWYVQLSRNLLAQIDARLHGIAAEAGEQFRAAAGSPARCYILEMFLHDHNWREYVQVVDARGDIICRSSSLADLRLPTGAETLREAFAGLPRFETVDGLESSPVRMVTYRLDDHRVPELLIQVGDSLAAVDTVLDDLRLFLLIFSPLAVIALSVGGWFLAGRTLAPMVRINHAARRINAENLSLRLPTSDHGDEIDQLADTFNSMLARLEDSFRKIKQFSGDASHELRTPLAILRGETEVSLRWAREPDDYRRTLESNLEEIDRMGRIIEDLLTLAKSDAGEMTMEMKELSLSDLLQELYLQGRTLAEGKGIEVLLHLEVGEEIRIRGDELRLRQMFLNLISNAIKYTPTGGTADITLSLENGQAVVAVADSGIGIPQEHLPHIFDRFYRIDKARNRADGGTGLGLAIVKSIVAAHSGRIEVTSTPGQGSVFTIRLPIGGPGEASLSDQEPGGGTH